MKHMERLTEDKGYSNEICSCRFLSAQIPISGAKNVSLLLGEGGHLSHGSFISCFWGDKGRSEHLFCTCRFSSVFSSKSSLCQSGICWGGLRCHPPHLYWIKPDWLQQLTCPRAVRKCSMPHSLTDTFYFSSFLIYVKLTGIYWWFSLKKKKPADLI